MSGTEHNTLAGARLDPHASRSVAEPTTTTETAPTSGVTGSSATKTADNQGIGSTVLSYIGLGGSKVSEAEGLRNVKEYESEPPLGSAGTGQTPATLGADAATLSGTAPTNFSSGVDATGTENYTSRDSMPTNEPTESSTSAMVDNARSSSTTDAGSDETATTAAPEDTRKVREVTGAGDAEETAENTSEGKTSKTGHGVDDKVAAKRENPDAIPIAGNEKLGKKHWGESKIVPDNPAPEGVASDEGQPDKSTSDNTAKNTGSATNPQDSQQQGGGKEKLTDKIKGMMHK